MVTKFGSHLYGTDTPESDLDYKGVYMPCLRDIFLGNIPKSVRLDTNMSNTKNSPDDIDIEIYSLHYFIELCLKGETVALDMLHANNNTIEIATPVWLSIVGKRHMFYTKNLRSFVGYARKQAAKYGLKGSRLDEAKLFLLTCDRGQGMRPDAQRMDDIWDLLVEGEHCQFLGNHKDTIMQYQICGKTIQSSMKIPYARQIIQKFYNQYGNRAKLASENKGVDWKAMSHAIRAAYQVREILRDGVIQFPLRQAAFLTEVKQGKHKFDYVIHKLETLMEDVERLTEASKLPEQPDREYWEDFIYKKVQDYIDEIDFYLTNEKE